MNKGDMNIKDYIEYATLMTSVIAGILGLRVIRANANKTEAEGSQTISTARKVEAETVQTIITSAGDVIETYKQILEKVEKNLLDCENECRETIKERDLLLVGIRKKDLELENSRADRERLRSRIVELETDLKEAAKKEKDDDK